MSDSRTARFLLLPLLVAGMLLSATPAALPAVAARPAAQPLTEAAAKSASHTADGTAVKTSPVEPVPRSPEDSREQFKQGRFVERTLPGNAPRGGVRGGRDDAGHSPGDESPVAQQVRLQI